MNVKLLKQVRDYIKNHPKEYDQSEWCGTTCCIAGHAAVLDKRIGRADLRKTRFKWNQIEIIGQMSLNLEASSSRRLFYSIRWPDKFMTPFHCAKDAAARSAIAVKRINHFIKTGGAE